MKPFVQEYHNDEKLQNDVQKLADNGIKKEHIYLMTHDEDRTERLANNTDANTVGAQEMNFAEVIGNIFSEKGEELRNKLQDLGFSESEADSYEEDLDEGKILLMVTESEDIKKII
ncbi:general stress protein [Pontibacillus salipaludis]|uniref:general stress protein n=1 Tax=Pontibacillus salipaludis TaxID=1697394 RepID=UPI0031F11C4F